MSIIPFHIYAYAISNTNTHLMQYSYFYLFNGFSYSFPFPNIYIYIHAIKFHILFYTYARMRKLAHNPFHLVMQFIHTHLRTHAFHTHHFTYSCTLSIYDHIQMSLFPNNIYAYTCQKRLHNK